MNKIFTSLFVLLCFFSSTTVFSQTVIWTEDFSNGVIPTGWTTIDASGQGFLWIYTTDLSLTFPNQPNFCSATVADGFLQMDSDAGLTATLPQNHDARITTNAIDCSSLSTVVVRFENQYSFFSAASAPELGVSTDGTNFSYYPILTGVASNALSQCVQIEEVDITADAANQSTVYLQWRWVGNWEYAWKIDDISVQDFSTVIPPSSLVITNFNAISTAFAFPINNADSIRFMADIENTGSATQTNVNLNVTVVNDATSAVVHSQNLTYGSIAADSLAENQLFPIAFAPDDSQIGSYTITYNLTSDSTDVDPTDNMVSHAFMITDSLFAKDNGITTQITPADDNSYTYGTHYYAYENTGDSSYPYQVLSMEFGCANPADMAGYSVDILLYEWDDIDGNLLVGNLNTELSIAAFVIYTFTGNEAINTFIKVPLNDFNNPSSLLDLKANTNYIIAVKYTVPISNPTLDFFLSITDEFNYAAADFAATQSGVARIAELLDVGNTGDLNGGFVGTNTPALRLNIVQNSTSTEALELPSNALKVFPSPATDYINADIELAELAKNAILSVYDIKGQLLQTKQLSNIKTDRVTFDVSEFPAGRYLINITTDTGVKTKFFTVIR